MIPSKLKSFPVLISFLNHCIICCCCNQGLNAPTMIMSKTMIFLLTSCNTEKRIAKNIYIYNSNRNYKKKKLITTTILNKKQI